MANLVITDTTNTIQVDFGDHASAYGFSKGAWMKDYILCIKLNSIGVEVLEENEQWWVSFDGAEDTLQIDSVNGVVPTSNNDLYTKIINLLG